MVLLDKKKSTLCMWCILMINAFFHVSFTAGSKKDFSSESSNDYSSSPHTETSIEEVCNSICDTKECVYQSKLLLDYMKPVVNPCENFYQFACGKIFEKKDPEIINSFSERCQMLMTLKLKNILVNTKADPKSASGKAKIVYNSCMKYSSSDLLALSTVLQFLGKLGIPDWPNLPADFKFVNTSLARVMGNLLAYQEYGFIEFSTEEEYMFLEDTDLLVNSSLSVGKCSYESKEKLIRNNQVIRILNYFDLDSKTIERIWNESEIIHDAILDLKEESKRIDSLDEDSTEIFLDCTQDTLNDSKDLCESLETLIQITASSDKVSKNYATIGGNNIYFMQNIFVVLSKFSDRSVANYLALNALLNNIKELNFYFRLIREKEKAATYAMHVSDIRWEKCVDWLASNMPVALGHEYVKTDFTVPMILEVQSLAQECVHEAAELVSRQEWLTDDQRKSVKEEVEKTIVSFDNFIEILPNITRVNEFYEQFQPTDENFLQNVLEYKKYFRIAKMRGIMRIVDIQWIKDIFLANAGGGGRTVDINFGLLLPPMYTPGLQRLMNLVSFGLIVLHEIGHNLESFIRSSIASDPKASDFFDEKIKCLEAQYSHFTLETIGKNMNGSKYIKENFADSIAITVLDKLIEKIASENSSISLPSHQYTVKQQMYIFAMQLWCAVHTKKTDEISYNLSTHSPSRYRVIGMIQNSKGFSEAFGCPDGSFMNPSIKCSFLD